MFFSTLIRNMLEMGMCEIVKPALVSYGQGREGFSPWGVSPAYITVRDARGFPRGVFPPESPRQWRYLRVESPVLFGEQRPSGRLRPYAFVLCVVVQPVESIVVRPGHHANSYSWGRIKWDRVPRMIFYL